MQTLESSPRTDAGTVSPRQSTFSVALHDHGNDPRWQLALRIAASSSLGRSRLMADFLFYIVDRHIHERSNEITEQQIGVLVFGRVEGYDTNEDNIVRSYARNLRKRIEEYFVREGVEESLLLEIPRGGYIPIFSSRYSTYDHVPEDPIEIHNHDNRSEHQGISPEVFIPTESAAVLEQDSRWGFISKIVAGCSRRLAKITRKSLAVFALSVGLVLGVLIPSLILKIWHRHEEVSSRYAESRDLWSQLFSSKSDTFVVPSDDGLVIMQLLTGRPVPLASYVNGSYRSSIKTDGDSGAAEILKLGARRYTSIVDLDFASRLAQLKEVGTQRMVIRYARDLRMDDLRDGNAILIGSIEANPWIELFQPHMNFRFSIHPGSDDASGIVNTHPRRGESPIYGTPSADHTYGLIAYLPNLNATGHVLIVGGLNTAGTQAAETFLLTPSLMESILQRARLPGGGLQTFELLIGSKNIASNAAAPEVVLQRIGPS